jgi:ligand-binding sensor domain-containing protein
MSSFFNSRICCVVILAAICFGMLSCSFPVEATPNPPVTDLKSCPIASEAAGDDEWLIVDRWEVEYTNIIRQDTEDRMWIATDGHGLSMYDGLNWHNWEPDFETVRSDAIHGLAIADNRVYASTYGRYPNGGVLIYDIDRDVWDAISPADTELSGSGTHGIAVDQEGNVFLPVMLLGITQTLPITTTTGKVFDLQNRTNVILDVYHNGEWQHIEMPVAKDDFPIGFSEGLIDTEGTYWLATNGLGLWEFNGEKWKVHTRAGKYITALALDQSGRLWIGTNRGAAMLDQKSRWHIFSPSKYPLSGREIEDIAIDSEGRVWFLTATLLYIYNGEEWATFKPSVTAGSLWGNAIAFDQQGCAWVDTLVDGVAVFRGNLEMDGWIGD